MQITDKLLALLMPNESKNHKLVKFKTHAIINYTDFLRDGSPYNISENNGNWNIELLNYKIVGSISKDGEFDFDCERYVEPINDKMYISYIDYTKKCKTKEESFISLIKSKRIPVGKKLNMKLLILEKNG
jgi:hypothetical protein